MPDVEPRYKRVLLKLSGEVLMGEKAFGVDAMVVDRLSNEVKEARDLGVEIGIMIGGGNFFRGVSEAGKQFERSTADTAGMLATVMNGLILQDALEKIGLQTRILSAIQMPQVCEMFIRRRAMRHLEKGRVVIFVAGTGHPYFSTDTGAALRALEIGAQAILKGTKVDGVFSDDPQKNRDAKFYHSLTFQEVIEKNLRVMDQTAVALCRENKLAIHVFNIKVPGNIPAILRGDDIGTTIKA
jgi:uridylate kinase